VTYLLDASGGKPGRQLRIFAQIPANTAAAGDRYATMKVMQQRRGLPLDENDLWIAATSLAINATLVSRDEDFLGISGLAVIAP
jgi:predicted nucleic acid-binding protein